MKIVINLIRYIFLFIIVFLLSAVLGKISWQIFNFFLPQSGGSLFDMDFSGIAGSILAYAFLAPMFALSLGEKYWIWALVVFMLPIIAFEFLSSASYIGLFIILTFAGLIAGYCLRFLCSKILGDVTMFTVWKKYF